MPQVASARRFFAACRMVWYEYLQFPRRPFSWQYQFARLCLKTRSYARQSVVSPLSGDRSYVGVRLFRQSLRPRLRHRHDSCNPSDRSPSVSFSEHASGSIVRGLAAWTISIKGWNTPNWSLDERLAFTTSQRANSRVRVPRSRPRTSPIRDAWFRRVAVDGPVFLLAARMPER